jgi:hypothetical protein
LRRHQNNNRANSGGAILFRRKTSRKNQPFYQAFLCGSAAEILPALHFEMAATAFAPSDCKSTEYVMTNTAIPNLPADDPLLAALGNVTFSSTPPAPLAAVPVDVDPEHAAIHNAVVAGTIPTFADDQSLAQPVPAVPIDPNAERAALMQFIAFINAYKDPNTIVTVADPDVLAQAFS